MIGNGISCAALIVFLHVVLGISWEYAVGFVLLGDTWWTVNETYYDLRERKMVGPESRAAMRHLKGKL